MDYTGVINTHVIAINDSVNYTYDKKVIAEIRQEERTDYLNLARKLNTSKIKLLVIEHDYGIYGGEDGEYILDLVNNLEIPIVTTLHTILSEPSPKQRLIINELGKKSEKIITMARNTKEVLQTIYDVEADKIDVIHHGVPKKQFEPRELLKKKYGYMNRQVISTFGLIGPGKGIEQGIEAIAKVVKSHTTIDNKIKYHKDVIYLILGQTHPALKEEGIAYRNKLVELINELDMNKNIKFINRYFSKDELIHYLQLSDIYMTPYLEKDQAVSGPLAYAVGYGKAIVSTPYLYAQEMLSEGNGLLAEFNNPDSIAVCLKQILDDPFKKAKMERNTLKIGRTMYWDKVVSQYTNVFLNIINTFSEVDEVNE
jgi:glycosyltransferase involved in cell wall biosynthesis